MSRQPSNNEERFWKHVKKYPGEGCWLWTAATYPNGYPKFAIKRGDDWMTVVAYRFSWAEEHGQIPAGMQLNHHCDQPLCVRPSHVYLGTQKDNIRDALLRGRLSYERPWVKRENSVVAKLDWEKVRTIRARWNAGETQTQLANAFGVDQTTVSDLLRGRTWREDGVKYIGQQSAKKGARTFLKRVRVEEPAQPPEPPRELPKYPDNPAPLDKPHELAPGEAERFWSKVAPANENGCRLWLASKDDAGYGQFGIGKTPHKAHRVAWRLTYGPIPFNPTKKLQLNHRCDIRACVEPTHLWLGTQEENNHDRAAKGRTVGPILRADENGNSKLSWSKVREIRRLREQQGWTVEALAKKFRISNAQVSNIINYRQWLEDVQSPKP